MFLHNGITWIFILFFINLIFTSTFFVLVISQNKPIFALMDVTYHSGKRQTIKETCATYVLLKGNKCYEQKQCRRDGQGLFWEWVLREGVTQKVAFEDRSNMRKLYSKAWQYLGKLHPDTGNIKSKLLGWDWGGWADIARIRRPGQLNRRIEMGCIRIRGQRVERSRSRGLRIRSYGHL